MSVSLLKEYVSLLLEHPKGFDMRFFKSLKTKEKALTYAWENLKELGRGSARHVYALNSKSVLKVAVNAKGLAQNEAELDVFTNPASKPIVTRIFDADPGYKWLVSEIVRPLDSSEEFRKLTGVDIYKFIRHLEGEMTGKPFPGSRVFNVPPKAQSFVDAVIATAKVSKLQPGDLNQYDHWGKTAAGRIVLLDSGFTEDVRLKHYTDPEPSNQFGHNDVTGRPSG